MKENRLIQWIEFKENKPKDLTVAVVAHEKCDTGYQIATYYPGFDMWVSHHCQSSGKNTLPIHVTHYFPIPIIPVNEDRD